MGDSSVERNAVKSESQRTQMNPDSSEKVRRHSKTRCFIWVHPCHLWFTFAFLFFLSLWGNSHAFAAPAGDHATVVLVVGAAGESDFEPNFSQQVTQWEKVNHRGGCAHVTIGVGEAPAESASDYEKLKQTLSTEPKDGTNELWGGVIGH